MSRKQLLDKISKILSESQELKDFHGQIMFNMAFGECKNFRVEQTFLPEKKEKP